MTLFNEMLGGENIPIETITAFYNPQLTTNFINAWNISNQRFVGAPNLFNVKVMKTFTREREWILSEYDRKVNYYDWNSSLRIPIVPCMFFYFYSVICLPLICRYFSKLCSISLIRLSWHRS